MTAKLPKVEWLGGPDDGMVQFVPDSVIQSGILLSAEVGVSSIKDYLDENPSPFSAMSRKILYPIKRFSVVDAITRRRYEKLMVVYYERKFE